MMPVKRRPAPKGFNAAVLRPGRAWLRAKGLLAGVKPKDLILEPYWQTCLDALHKRYRGVCAYVSIYIDKVTGARSVDHFIAKSSALEHAYRWSNYRLACQKMNARKGIFDDVLDPFEIEDDTFVLNLIDGSILPSPRLDTTMRTKAQATIDRLGLDEADCRTARREYVQDCQRGHISIKYLQKKCPFVWHEMRRQNALPSEKPRLPRASETRAHLRSADNPASRKT